MKTIRFAVVLGCLIGAGTHSAVAQFENVGSIDFPTSETGRAQQHFLRGVAILHSSWVEPGHRTVPGGPGALSRLRARLLGRVALV